MPPMRQTATTATAARVLKSTRWAMARPSIRGLLSPRSCRSCLAIVQQHETDDDKAERPNPGGDPSGRRIETQLEPTSPARCKAEQGERNMRQLDEKLLLGVDHGMRMGQEQGAADGGDHREGEGGLR